MRWIALCLVMVGMCNLAGCSRLKPRQQYKPLLPVPQSPAIPQAQSGQTGDRLITARSAGQTLGSLCQMLSREYGISFVIAADVIDKPVTCRIDAQPIGLVLDTVAQAAGTSSQKRGESLFYFGTLRPQDRSIFVGRVYRLEPSAAVSLLTGLVQPEGMLTVAPDGLVVGAGSSGAITLLASVVDSLANTPIGAYSIEARILTARKSLGESLFLTATPSANGSIVAKSKGITADGQLGLAAAIQALADDTSTEIVGQPSLVVLDGQTAEVSIGSTRPVQRSQVVGNGQVVESYQEQVKAGSLFKVACKRADDKSLLLDITLEQTSFDDASNGIATTGTAAKLPLVAELGQVYLAGVISEAKTSKRLATKLRWGSGFDQATHDTFVFVRATRLAPCEPASTSAAAVASDTTGGQGRAPGQNTPSAAPEKIPTVAPENTPPDAPEVPATRLRVNGVNY